MAKIIQVDIDKCIGCRLCEMYCSFVHGGRGAVDYSRIKVLTFFPGVEVPNLCFHCKDAPCKSSCPVSAIEIDENFVVHIDNQKCIGCQKCVKACPAEAIQIVKGQKYPVVCDLCKGKPEMACVEVCPTKALIFQEVPFDGSCYAKTPKEKAFEYCKKNSLEFDPK